MGFLQAVIDAIHGSDEKIGGQALTRLALPLTPVDTKIVVDTTHGFGEYRDGTGNARVLVGGEVIDCSSRTPIEFNGLTRGVLASKIKNLYPVTTLVYDLSGNVSAIDLVRRGFLVEFAIGSDLDVIARNLGLPKCPGLSDDQWRAIIQATAYLAKQPIDAFNQALVALLGAGNFQVSEDIMSRPWHVFVAIAVLLAHSLRGRFVLNGGEFNKTIAGGTEVVTGHPINHVIGVYLDTVLAERGERLGLTNYFTGGSFAGSTITLGTPTIGEVQVIVDYGAFKAHYLPADETILDDGDDFYPYLTDPLSTARCLLDHVRAAGIHVDVTTL